MGKDVGILEMKVLEQADERAHLQLEADLFC